MPTPLSQPVRVCVLACLTALMGYGYVIAEHGNTEVRVEFDDGSVRNVPRAQVRRVPPSPCPQGE